MQRLRRATSRPTQDALATSSRDMLTPDICVIGGGPGGLSVAAAAAAFGRRVVLIEKHKMGGDSLNYGCVPSKALIAAANRAHAIRTSRLFGIEPVSPQVDHKAVRDHVQAVIAAIAPNDSIERFTALGVHVIQASARFVGKKTVAAGEHRIRARRFVIATGSSPLVPSLPGFDKVPFFTNETTFENTARIEHLIVIGGGPVGMELAQAYSRLGSKVTVLEGLKALGGEDPELAAVAIKALRAEGVDIREGAMVSSVDGVGGDVRVRARTASGDETIAGSHLLVAAGRRPNIADLGLDAAHILYNQHGIIVGGGLMTSNSRVFAIGDCVQGPRFTHVADYHAGIVIRRALFRLPATVKPDIIPRVAFTSPELACVGLTEAQARGRHYAIEVLRWPYSENDRAQVERTTSGFVKVIVDKKGRILGAGIAGAGAGELIQMWALAVSRKVKIKAMTDWISPYPTLSEVNKRAAFRYYAAAASNRVVRKLVDVLANLG